MARKGDSGKWFNVAVVGLSGSEKDKGAVGVGKSCLCNRFMRSLADEYSVDHISVLSQSDFSGRVVNNDHFLYWGEVTKTSEEGIDFQFQVVEQTEFIDDASFQPFKAGKMEAYVKRCVATKLTSAEKLMYICKNQLGIEKEYEQKVLPDGKINIDGFICVFDVSVVPSRSLEKQVEVVTSILNNIMKTKKPVVLVTTKNDDANETYVKETEKILIRKEYKGAIPIVETSAHENINVDLAFITLAQLIDRNKGRPKMLPYFEAARSRKDQLELITECFQNLIRNQVTDYRAIWSTTYKLLSKHEEMMRYVQEFGLDSTQRLFRRHVKKLKDENLSKKVQNYMELLPDILHEMVPDLASLSDCDWAAVQEHIKQHPDFDNYFYKSKEDVPWTEFDWATEDSAETRIPYDILDTAEAESLFKNHANILGQQQRRVEWKKQFKQLLEETGYVTPGKSLGEIKVLFMGHECFENLTEHDCQQIYDAHQKEIVEKAKHNFQELLLEHADLFYHFKSIAPTGTITQDDIREITDALKDDFRYKALDRLDQDRKLMLFQHLGFVHCPIREHCPAFPNCMDALIERILVNKAHRPSSWNNSSQWLLSVDNNQLNLVVLGTGGLANQLSSEIKGRCDEDELEIDCQLYSLDCRVIDGDVSLPHNSFQSTDFLPHGCFCVYSDSESFEYIRESLEKTLLSNLAQDDRLPFQGLPIVMLFVLTKQLDEKEIIKLRDEGQNLADSVQCAFIDASLEEHYNEEDASAFTPSLVTSALRQLLQSIRHRAGFVNIYQSVMECSEPDIRIIMCTFCGDPYSVENVLGPLLNHQCCFLSGERSIILETFLGSSKRKVEVVISSFHGANAFREELVHGFILVYSTKRKASLATLNAFSMNIPNLPIQIMAVTDAGGASAFFNSDLSHQLITEGNATADRLQAHFMTSSSSCQPKTAFYTPFFKEVWDKKPEIERAFHMEDPFGANNNCDDEAMPSRRNHSYNLKLSNEALERDVYERLTGDGRYSPSYCQDQMVTQSDDSDTYSPMDSHSKKNPKSPNKLHHGFQVFPPPATPPEPAPPDHPPRHSGQANILGSNTSLDDITCWVDDSVFAQHGEQNDGMFMNNFSHHSFTTGRRHPSKNRFKGMSHTMKQPGKLNMKDYTLVTDAINRMSIGNGKEVRLAKIGKSSFRNAPLATPEPDIGNEYAQVKDAVNSSCASFDNEYAYPHMPDALSCNKMKMRPRRDKGPIDSDSDCSSSERRQKAGDAYPKVNRKSTNHKRARKKRTAIPVATPRVPNLPSGNGIHHQSSRENQIEFSGLGQSHEKSDSDSLSQETGLSDADASWQNNASKCKMEGTYTLIDPELSLDVSSPCDISMSMLGAATTKESEKTLRRKEKQKQKEEERKLKVDKVKKQEDREKKKRGKGAPTKSSSTSGGLINHLRMEDFAQSETNAIPLILEKCIRFVESEGLDSEGIYRVPGNRAHVELLFHKFEEDPNVDINSLDVPVNAIATALKDFFSKRLPPLLPKDIMSELEELYVICDKSCRLLALRTLLQKLPPSNFQILKFVFRHFVKVSENCKLNSMDSKNLAICWWPTLLPIEFSDMGRFEQMRPHLEDIIQTMIDQYPFLFCGEEAFVMV